MNSYHHVIVLMAFNGLGHYVFNGAHRNFLRSLCRRRCKQTKKKKSGNFIIGFWERTQRRAAVISPFVPIHNWSCSSLNVSLTFPPDLLNIPDKGTVGNRSCWRDKAVAHHVWLYIEHILVVATLNCCGSQYKTNNNEHWSSLIFSHLCSFNSWHYVIWFTFVQNLPVLLK